MKDEFFLCLSFCEKKYEVLKSFSVFSIYFIVLCMYFNRSLDSLILKELKFKIIQISIRSISRIFGKRFLLVGSFANNRRFTTLFFFVKFYQFWELKLCPKIKNMRFIPIPHHYHTMKLNKFIKLR